MSCVKSIAMIACIAVVSSARAGEETKTLFDVPTPLFQTTAKCVKWASGNWPWPAKGGWKTCSGHAYTTKFFHVGAKLKTKWPDNADQAIQAATTAAVAYCSGVAYQAALAAVAAAPEPATKTAASAAAIPAFYSCIETKKAGEAAIAGALSTSSAEIVTFDQWK